MISDSMPVHVDENVSNKGVLNWVSCERLIAINLSQLSFLLG